MVTPKPLRNKGAVNKETRSHLHLSKVSQCLQYKAFPNFNIEDTLSPTSKMLTSEASPLSRPKGVKLPHFQDHSKYHPFARPFPEDAPHQGNMISNTSTTYLNTSLRYCSHCNSVYPTTSSTKPRRIRSHHCRYDRQNPLTSSIYRH